MVGEPHAHPCQESDSPKGKERGWGQNAPKEGPTLGKGVAEKGQAEASLLSPSPQLELEKEKLGAMQAHLAGKMALPKDPTAVSHPRPLDLDCWAGEGPHGEQDTPVPHVPELGISPLHLQTL
jgi:hypothetical protein